MLWDLAQEVKFNGLVHYEVTCWEMMESAFTAPEIDLETEHLAKCDITKHLPMEYSHFIAKRMVHQFAKFISHFPVDHGPIESVPTPAMQFMLNVVDNHWLLIFRTLIKGSNKKCS